MTAKLFFKLKETLFNNRLDSKYHNSLYGFDNDTEYDPYNESPEEESQAYFFPNPSTPGLENYGDNSMSTHPSGLYYPSGYYRSPSPYAMGPYYIQSSFPQNSGANPNIFGIYQGGDNNANMQ